MAHPNRVRIVTVTDADRVKLERRARDRGAPARVADARGSTSWNASFP